MENENILLWVLKRWIFTDIGLIGFLTFLLGVYYIFKQKNQFKLRKNLPKIYLFIFAFFLFLSFFLEYNILKILAIFLGLFFCGLAFFKLSQKQISLILIWLFFSLPIIPLLGSTIGIANRIFYVYVLKIFMSPDQIIGTSLFNENYQFSIDSACSGVLGIYLIACFWIIYCFKKNKINFPSFILTITLFWLLNTFRIFLLYVFHNKLHYDNLNNFDLFLGILFLAISLAFLYKKLENSKANL